MCEERVHSKLSISLIASLLHYWEVNEYSTTANMPTKKRPSKVTVQARRVAIEEVNMINFNCQAEINSRYWSVCQRSAWSHRPNKGEQEKINEKNKTKHVWNSPKRHPKVLKMLNEEPCSRMKPKWNCLSSRRCCMWYKLAYDVTNGHSFRENCHCNILIIFFLVILPVSLGSLLCCMTQWLQDTQILYLQNKSLLALHTFQLSGGICLVLTENVVVHWGHHFVCSKLHWSRGLVVCSDSSFHTSSYQDVLVLSRVK